MVLASQPHGLEVDANSVVRDPVNFIKSRNLDSPGLTR